MKIKLLLENASGVLDESETVEVLDETDVSGEVDHLMSWALLPGDVIRIVEVT